MLKTNHNLEKAFQYHQIGDYENALQYYKKIIESDSKSSIAHALMGTVYIQQGLYQKAVFSLQESIRLNIASEISHANLGVAFYNLGNYEKSISSLEKAITLKPDYFDAYNNLGNSYRKINKTKDAIKFYNEAIRLNPQFAEAYNNRGNVYFDLGNYSLAIEDFKNSIKNNPLLIDSYLGLGGVFAELDDPEKAIYFFDRAIQLQPSSSEAYCGRAFSLNTLKKYEESCIAYKKAYELNDGHDFLLGSLAHLELFLCDWNSFDERVEKIKNKTRALRKVSPPFNVLSLIDDPYLQKQSSEIFIKTRYQLNMELGEIPKYLKHERIRIGYFSADFHNHATMHLMAELFEYHDKNQFELFGFSFGPDLKDEWRSGVVSCFDKFIDVVNKSDVEIASLAREFEVDIAIDLKGFTGGMRTNIFAHRAAPIQVNYLGYPGTMGAEYMDYLIADPVLIPEDKQKYYTEKIVYLPNSYQVNIKDRVISQKVFTRESEGLPENAFVFCSFNNNYKITPKTFDCWMRILEAVDGSVLWILSSNQSAVENLKKEAEKRGIDARRLIFASHKPVEEHLKRIQLANLFLDTLPCNAHTTASDALRVGLPVLTLIGNSFAGRVAASLLNSVGLPDLVTTTKEDYEFLAIEFARNPEKFYAIKNKLSSNLHKTALYDIRLFTKHLECAYEIMYENYLDDLDPQHIYVKYHQFGPI